LAAGVALAMGAGVAGAKGFLATATAASEAAAPKAPKNVRREAVGFMGQTPGLIFNNDMQTDAKARWVDTSPLPQLGISG
jgi:hypothetical protein